MRSILLGVMVFITVLTAKKATTNQIPTREIDKSSLKKKPLRASTSDSIKPRTSIFTKATTLIFGGYLPGYFPPMDAFPHGAPNAKLA